MLFFTFFLLLPTLLTSPTFAKSVRIIGGNTAFAGQFPFAAAIYKRTNDGTFFCVGSLLNHEWILTAGQCVDGASLFTIRLGSNSLSANDENAIRLSTDTFVLHPKYDPLTLENDIGLIKFRMAISYTTYIKPVDFLPHSDLVPFTGTVALGWGQTDDETPGVVDDLRWVSLTVLSNEECQSIYGHNIYENMVCAEGNYNEGTCKGDSGSPLVQNIGGYLMQVGVASFLSAKGCESTDPSGYTRVYPYSEWIYNVTGM
ncbi:brachyurin-like [Tribolium madens]|uniref:brachyurin-like n=1 Tax=Tribolium madens TaxID=41895 RepID=UPI001CF75372|nr:brachyurin-like [Tribolium madens]